MSDHAALHALVAENQQQAKEREALLAAAASLTQEVDEAYAENQRLRDAAERVIALDKRTERLGFAQGILRAALDGTP